MRRAQDMREQTDTRKGHIATKGFALCILPVVMMTLGCAPKLGLETSPTPSSEETASAPQLVADTTAALPFDWIIPEGWIAETIPFPLGFAPGLPYSGLEELRFAPGMFKAESEDFWTYAFVWWLEGDVRFDARTLNSDLVKYYEGLSLAVEGEGFDPEKAAAVATLAPSRRVSATESEWAGALSTHDAFATHARVELHLEVEAIRSETVDRTAVTFLVSPQPRSHAVWTELTGLREAFHQALNAAE